MEERWVVGCQATTAALGMQRGETHRVTGCVACMYCSETKHLRILMLFSSNNYLNFPAFSALCCYYFQ